MKRSVNRWLEARSSADLVVSCVLLCSAIGFVDYEIGVDLSLPIFYLVPIAIASWYANCKAGIFLSALSSLVWLWADMATSPLAAAWLPAWDLIVRMAFFAVASYLISTQKQDYKRERLLARLDGLTSIYNRRTFMEILQTEIARSRRYQSSFTLAYLDVDNFKAVNDKLGHEEGDRLLADLAGQIRALVRASDTIGRLGGDEFAILLTQISASQAERSLQRVHAQLQLSVGRRWPVNFSVGAISFSRNAVSADEAIAQADRVMYEVKRTGKSRLAFRVVEEGEVPDREGSAGQRKREDSPAEIKAD